MNTTALAIIQPDELDTIQRTGKMLAASGYFDAKGDGPKEIAMMAVKILAGREMGFGPFASVNNVHIINGKPSIGANLLASAVKSRGRYNYKVRELTAKVCRIEFFEREGDKWVSAGVSEYTIEEATTAKLTGKEVWQKFPKNMLFARALSNGVRWYCPDVSNGNAIYTPEELGADVDEEGNVIETTAQRVMVDSSTGEIIETPVSKNEDTGYYDDGISKAPATAEEVKVFKQWKNRTEAEMWAVMTGACENEFEAKNSMEKSIVKCGGEVTKENWKCVYTHFIRRQMEKLNEMAEAAVEQAVQEPELAF